MKKIRKITAVLLVALMMMSLMSVQSFAALDFLRAPRPQKVEILDETPISIADIRCCADAIEEMEADGIELEEEDYRFYLGESLLDYEYEITLTNGKKVKYTNDDFGYVEVDEVYEVDCEAYIEYEDWKELLESDLDTVEVRFEIFVYSNLLDREVDEEPAVFALEKSVVPCVVKAITPVSGMPTALCEDCDYIDLEGAKFRVTYADGSKKTLSVKQSLPTEDDFFNNINYTLGDKELIAYEYEGDLALYYEDAEYNTKIKHVKSTVKDVEITDYDFSEEEGLKEISYTITRTNGKSYDYTKTFTVNEAGITEPYGILDAFDGYYVTLNPYVFSDIEEMDLNKMYFCISVGSAEDYISFDLPGGEALSILSAIAEKVTEAIAFLRNLIEILIGFITAKA